MSRAARLLDLLQLLRRHRRPLTGLAIAAELGISLRTLYRDIATLQAQGAAIDGAPGLGYQLRDGFLLPPLMFGADELDALVLGCRWVADRADPALAAAARDALAKISAVLPPERRMAVEHSGLLVGPATPAEQDPEALATLRRAIRAEHRLRIGYRDVHGETSQRVVWPLALGFFDRVQVLVAWCELRGALRHFRTDRISTVDDLTERYPRRRATLLAEWRAEQGITADGI
ncbi:helix-turn-helix transcriptional regulator [Ideonella alba]|uniref:YafY family transcriptional regulator n=1 Tax=Ideonella alba TaxID=2824118 RepID=A0A941BF74_9BURK|nr:YafY family protein [Ideonella alba]MBQ0929118.1 YafY family transcriptional regulator [Ideonella alba]